MASQSTQISVKVSKETKKFLDAYTRKRGIKKSFVIEQALRHHLLAAEEIPGTRFRCCVWRAWQRTAVCRVEASDWNCCCTCLGLALV